MSSKEALSEDKEMGLSLSAFSAWAKLVTEKDNTSMRILKSNFILLSLTFLLRFNATFYLARHDQFLVDVIKNGPIL